MSSDFAEKKKNCAKKTAKKKFSYPPIFLYSLIIELVVLCNIQQQKAAALRFQIWVDDALFRDV